MVYQDTADDNDTTFTHTTNNGTRIDHTGNEDLRFRFSQNQIIFEKTSGENFIVLDHATNETRLAIAGSTKLRTQKELVKSKFNPSGIEDSMETLLSSLKTNVEEVESFSSDEESIAGINSRADLLTPLGSPAAQGISIVIEERDEDEDDNTTDNSGNNV